jgi:hypothetical protein
VNFFVGRKELQKCYRGIKTPLWQILFFFQKWRSLEENCKEYGTIGEAKELVNKPNTTWHHTGAVCMPDD